MIEVFKTNVRETQAATVVAALSRHLFLSRIDLDLEDRDKVLRVEGADVRHAMVIAILQEHGCECVPLE